MTSHSAFRRSLKTHFYNLEFYHDFIDYVMHGRSMYRTNAHYNFFISYDKIWYDTIRAYRITTALIVRK